MEANLFTKSYVVETNTGVYLRNRKYLRPQRSKEEAEEKEGESVAVVGGNLTPQSQQTALESSGEAPAVGQPRKKGARAPTRGRSPVVTRARGRLLDRPVEGEDDAVH